MSSGQNSLPKGGSLAVLGLAAILLATWCIGPPAGFGAELQKRPVAEFPDLDFQALASRQTYGLVNDALSDRLRTKPWAVGFVNQTVLTLTGQSASPQVMSGSRQELFYGGEFTEPCLYLGDPHAAQRGMDALMTAARSGGKTVLFVVVPSKSSVVAGAGGFRNDALMQCVEESDQILSDLARTPGSPLRFITTAEVLEVAPRKPYWSGDTHWTPRGGISLSEAVAEELVGFRASDTERMKVLRSQPHRGDLYALLGLGRPEQTDFWGPTGTQSPRFTTLPGSFRWPPQSFTTESPVLADPNSALIVYDSFVYAPEIESQIAGLFARGHIAQWDALADISAIPSDDIVVFETTQRLALGRLAGMQSGGPLQVVLDYIAAH